MNAEPLTLEGFTVGGNCAGLDPAEPYEPFGARPVLELDRLRAMMRDAGIEDTVDRQIDLFLEDAPTRMRALEAAGAEPVGEEVRFEARAFGTAARDVQAPSLAAALERIELAAAAGRTSDATHLLPLVQEQHHAVAALLAEVVAQRNSPSLAPLSASGPPVSEPRITVGDGSAQLADRGWEQR